MENIINNIKNNNEMNNDDYNYLRCISKKIIDSSP